MTDPEGFVGNLTVCRTLGRLLLRDLSQEKSEVPQLARNMVQVLAGTAFAEASRLPLVYTAFDGDHQQLTPLMARHVLRRGMVPVNPHRVLAYKLLVDNMRTKERVLEGDLGILKGCDELWVFTDKPARAASLNELAEGVVVEILYFSFRYPLKPIRFVSLTEMATKDAKAKRLRASFTQLRNNLSVELSEALRLANSKMTVDRRLRPAKYYLQDPQDFKYAEWLRAHSYTEGYLPVVPTLAIDACELGESLDSMGMAVLSWIKLSELCSDAAVYRMHPESNRRSIVLELLESCWERRNPGRRLEYSTYDRLGIPKLTLGSLWPVTVREKLLIRAHSPRADESEDIRVVVVDLGSIRAKVAYAGRNGALGQQDVVEISSKASDYARRVEALIRTTLAQDPRLSNVFVVATEWARRTENRRVLNQLRRLGIHVSVLRAEQEGTIILGALSGKADMNSASLLLEIGGGSIQLSRFAGTEVVSSSHALGTLVLQEIQHEKNFCSRRELARTKRYVSTMLHRSLEGVQVDSILVAGTGLADFVKEAAARFALVSDDFVFRTTELSRLLAAISGKQYSDLRECFPESHNIVEGADKALAIAIVVARLTAAKELRFLRTGLADALAMQIANKQVSPEELGLLPTALQK